MSAERTIVKWPTDFINTAFVAIFLLGIYLGIDIRLSSSLPIPTVIAGCAGALLLLVNWRQISERHLTVLGFVICLYLISILFADNYSLLRERFKGFVQIGYSLIIGYAFFLALMRFDRLRLQRLLLIFCLAILIGCFLENYAGLRDISDSFRTQVFSIGVYNSDLRDEALYGSIRPRLFTSEPSYVSFAYIWLLYSWFVLSTWRWKYAAYAALLAAGFVLMRGPTLLVGLVLMIPYELFLAAWREGAATDRYDWRRVFWAVGLTCLLVTVIFYLGKTLYSVRLSEILDGRDPSFFGRIIAPYLTAKVMLLEHPVAGAGITGWEFIGQTVQRVYATSVATVLPDAFSSPVDAITNYFWSHWIFLGLVWGTVLAGALTGLLVVLRVPSISFVWIVWIAFGNTIGSYVSPRTWAVFYLAGAVACIYRRQAEPGIRDTYSHTQTQMFRSEVSA